MKKFSQYLEEKTDFRGFKPSEISTANKDEILNMFSKLDVEDRRIIKNQIVELFGQILNSRNGFVQAADFVISNAKGDYGDKLKDNMVARIKSFFQNPITKGLGYLDGENQVINDPNPNQNGATNNNYYS